MTRTDARSVTDPENDHLEVKLRNAIEGPLSDETHLVTKPLRGEAPERHRVE
jgi:hypothetical protein